MRVGRVRQAIPELRQVDTEAVRIRARAHRYGHHLAGRLRGNVDAVPSRREHHRSALCQIDALRVAILPIAQRALLDPEWDRQDLVFEEGYEVVAIDLSRFPEGLHDIHVGKSQYPRAHEDTDPVDLVRAQMELVSAPQHEIQLGLRQREDAIQQPWRVHRQVRDLLHAAAPVPFADIDDGREVGVERRDLGWFDVDGANGEDEKEVRVAVAEPVPNLQCWRVRRAGRSTPILTGEPYQRRDSGERKTHDSIHMPNSGNGLGRNSSGPDAENGFCYPRTPARIVSSTDCAVDEKECGVDATSKLPILAVFGFASLVTGGQHRLEAGSAL